MAHDYSGTLAIFAKEPRAGRAKTRLIPALGAENAARFAAACLHDLLRRLSVHVSPRVRLLICYDPPESRSYFAELQQSLALPRELELLCQSPGGLGERLSAVAAAISGPLAFIGTDAPDLPYEYIAEALHLADEGRAYILKTSDGGYALLALPTGTPPSAFSAIAWSTADTGRQQIERIEAQGISIFVCEQTWWDIDEPADLLPLRRRLETNSQVASETLEVLRSFGALPGERPPL